MTSDGELLRRYAETNAEEAFAELVRRHLDLVYSAALRQVNGDAHLAQDVAQKVFSALARKAAALSDRAALTGWLYTCAHFTAAKVVRTESRRRTHEQEAQAMHELLQTPSTDFDWEQLQPVLDQVMHQLKTCDREAILMRYFENRPLAEIGERLGLSEDTERKRVDRALEELRRFLSELGITTTAALAAVLSTNAVQLAPASLAATLTSASLAGAAAGTGTTITLLKLMTMTKLQAGIISAVVVAGVATPLVIQRESKLRGANQSLRQQVDQIAQLQAESDRLSNLVAQAEGARILQTDQAQELLRLRGEVGMLRRQTNDIGKLRAENGQLRSALNTASATSKDAVSSKTALENVPRESWTFSGYADTESDFQSTIWAMSQGDAKTFLASLSPDGREFKHSQGKSEDEIVSRGKQEVEKVTAFKIIDKQVVSENEAILTIYASGINESTRFRLQRIGSDWKFAGPAKGEDQPAPK